MQVMETRGLLEPGYNLIMNSTVFRLYILCLDCIYYVDKLTWIDWKVRNIIFKMSFSIIPQSLYRTIPFVP